MSYSDSRLTAPDRQYGTCQETHAELRIYSDCTSAYRVTCALGLEPTKSQEKGSLVKNSRGRVRMVSRTGWFLSSEGAIDSKDLRDHLDWLINKLSNVASALQVLQEQPGTKMTISCVWWSAAGHGGPVLWPEQMDALAKLNLECSFDVYFSDDEP